MKPATKSTKTPTLKAYHVWPWDDPGECSYLCFATDAGKARAMCRHCDGMVDCGFTEIHVRRLKRADAFIESSGNVARVASWDSSDDRLMLRQLGWMCEGEGSCDACGLYPCDLDEFAICTECGSCMACCECCVGSEDDE